jgi:signal transduction histidine kinase
MTAKPPIAWLTGLLAAAACLGIAAFSVFGYRAALEWRRGSALLIQRQEEEGARLLVTAITRDMRGAQSVLADRDWGDFSTDSPNDLSDLVEATFSRYPYPESFFSWQEGAQPTTFFNRENRPPPWMAARRHTTLYPVTVVVDPPQTAALRTRIESYAAAHRRYAFFGTRFGGESYQIIARLTYRDALLEHLQSVTGFTVNLAWVRRSYFPEIMSQVARIADSENDLDLAVFDDQGKLVSGARSGDQITRRAFPLLFLDPASAMLDPTSLAVPIWTVRVNEKTGSPLLQTRRRAGWTLLAVGAAVLSLALSVVLAMRTVRTGVALAEMRSDFVSSVTHDLKTPLASIRALADTLHRRQLDPDIVRTYAQLMTQETKRLMRLVDNLLAYSRVTDVTGLYSFEPIAPSELVDDVLKDFRHQLQDGAFNVDVDIQPDVPFIRGDRVALMLALNNLVDNAIRYAGEERAICVSAEHRASRVVMEVRDRGLGIPADELTSVQRKFVRGRFMRAGGSGMGLAIVNRVVADHAGLFVLESQLGSGTVARMFLPIAGV